MRAFSKSIVETVRHPLLAPYAELKVQRANHVFRQVFHVPQGQAEGSPFFGFGGRDWDAPLLRSLLREVIAGSLAFEDFEVEHDFPQAGRKALLLNGRPVFREVDRSPLILLAIEDVSEKKQAQADLRSLDAELEDRVGRRTAQLEEANREMEAFCYSVSHDLRAPLRAIDGFSQELLHSYGDKLDDQGKHYLQRVRVGSQRMAQLIDDLLQLSHLSRSDMRRRAVDLSALAKIIAAELERRQPGRDATLVIQPGLTAWGDPGLLRIALENLLENAWKFTCKRPQATIEVGKAEVQGRSTFFVRDDGAGFNAAFAGKLFGAFQRLHRERDFPGAGTGLATIHRHGGRVWAEGVVDKEASFYFPLRGAEGEDA